MIDFRYHLVSLIAVFLAVALGIVIGTTQLNGPVLTNLQDQVSALQTDKRLLEDETQSLQTQLDSQGGFAEEVGPALVAGTLTGRRVLLVVTDEGVEADVVDEVGTLLDAAGAAIIEGPVARQGGRRTDASSVYARDPDGNLLEFMIYPHDRRQGNPDAG